MSYLDTSNEALAKMSSDELNTLMEHCFAWAELYSKSARTTANEREYAIMQNKIIKIQEILFPRRSTREPRNKR